MSEEIVLSELSLEDLYELMKEDLYDGLAGEIEAEVREALSRGVIDAQEGEALAAAQAAVSRVIEVDAVRQLTRVRVAVPN